MKALIAFAALLAFCTSGLTYSQTEEELKKKRNEAFSQWVQHGPEGWKRLDFICMNINSGYQSDEWFHVSENGYDQFERTSFAYESTPSKLIKRVYPSSDDTEGWDFTATPNAVWTIDRSTGRMSYYRTWDELYVEYDCELRQENKF